MMKTQNISVVMLVVGLAIAGCEMVDDGLGASKGVLVPDVVVMDIVQNDIPMVADTAGVDISAQIDAGNDTSDIVSNPTAGRFTYIACIADTHIVETDGAPAVYLRQIGETLKNQPYELAGIFVAGDIVFNLPYGTLQEYIDDPYDRFDVAEEIFTDFPAPVYTAFGNHDYKIGTYDPQISVDLFQRHFGVDPYYSVDLGTWKFIVLNNFLGATQDPESPEYDLQSGSLGDEQIAWLREELSEGKPSILMVHFPLFIMQDLPGILEEYTDTARVVLTGHAHSWVNLSDHYAVPNMIMGSSQYDADSFMIMELDNELKTWRILNWNAFHWGTSYAVPYDWNR